MLRSHIYYSASFIPGQFNPDSWNVPKNSMFSMYDDVIVIMRDSAWETSGEMFHRNSVFDPVIINTDNSFKTNELSEHRKANSFIFNEELFGLNQASQAIILNSVVFNVDDLKLNTLTDDSYTINSLVIQKDNINLSGLSDNKTRLNALGLQEFNVNLSETLSGSLDKVFELSVNNIKTEVEPKQVVALEPTEKNISTQFESPFEQTAFMETYTDNLSSIIN